MGNFFRPNVCWSNGKEWILPLNKWQNCPISSFLLLYRSITSLLDGQLWQFCAMIGKRMKNWSCPVSRRRSLLSFPINQVTLLINLPFSLFMCFVPLIIAKVISRKPYGVIWGNESSFTDHFWCLMLVNFTQNLKIWIYLVMLHHHQKRKFSVKYSFILFILAHYASIDGKKADQIIAKYEILGKLPPLHL